MDKLRQEGLRPAMVVLALPVLLVVSGLAAATTHPQAGEASNLIEQQPLMGQEDAPTGDIYDPVWSSVNGGGGTFSTDGDYTLGGTIGQPGTGSQTDGNYTLDAGFWVASTIIKLVGHVTWQGGGVQPNERQQQPITLTLKLGTTEVNYPSQNTDASGFFTVSVGGLPNGSYDWRVKGPKFLASAGSVSLTGVEQTNRQMGQQQAGDANNNNIVNSVDFSLLRAAFGTSNDLRTDFNNDGITNSVDFNLLRGNFGTGGDPPIGPGAP